MSEGEIIVPIPPIPKGIMEAVNNRKLAVFVGAGVSRLIGCMGWDELAKRLLLECHKEVGDDGQHLLNYREKEFLSRESDHRRIITICYHLLENCGKREKFFDVMRSSLEAKAEHVRQFGNVFRDLIRFNSMIITTNADEHFHNLYRPENIAFQLADFTLPADSTRLYHIHGCIKDQGSLVFTLPEYLKRYSDGRFRTFVEGVLDKYIVLFIGYGVAELEMLEFLVRQNQQHNVDAKHFLLSAYYRSEQNILACHRLYYRDLGIQVIPYAMDDIGYDQLIVVIENWAKQIRLQSFSEVAQIDIIDRVIDGN